ncbi:hypothetical protein ACJMK2_031913 [Sinanodonta woodiana]|uniref:Uncharacterized protein n=1 Tax=Sinanodonta woodiana TaxID=1069815 RepID=A0ABD3X205_SINWO
MGFKLRSWYRDCESERKCTKWGGGIWSWPMGLWDATAPTGNLTYANVAVGASKGPQTPIEQINTLIQEARAQETPELKKKKTTNKRTGKTDKWIDIHSE